MRFACPSCGKDTALWQEAEVHAWVTIESDGTRGKRAEVDYLNVTERELTPNGGCGECGWDGPVREMERELTAEERAARDPRQTRMEVA